MGHEAENRQVSGRDCSGADLLSAVVLQGFGLASQGKVVLRAGNQEAAPVASVAGLVIWF